MELFDVILIGAILGVVAILYSSVGHGGASGYIAIMALFSLSPEVIRPIALSLNVVVAGFATWRFSKTGYTDWRSAVPIILASVPMAFVGGSVDLPGSVYRPLLGTLLVFSAVYMAWSVTRSHRKYDNGKRTLPLVGSASAGGIIGLISGLSGIGGGVMLSPLFLIAGWAGVNAGPKTHHTPGRKCTTWLALAGVIVHRLVGCRFVHRPARRSAPTEQRSCAGLWSNRVAELSLQVLSD